MKAAGSHTGSLFPRPVREQKTAPPQKNLDTLAQLRKQIRNKFITNGLVYRLVDLEFSTMRKSYWNTFHCNRVIDQEGKKLSGKYCNNRWCNACNRIRTANLMNGYMPQLEKLYDKHFVTLTIPNVKASELKDAIELMHKRFKQLRDRMRKQGRPVIGLRKLECTYNRQRNDYHPHFHLIVENAHVAKCITHDWLAYYPGTRERAQDYKPADNNAVKELFKYFSKMITTQKDETGSVIDRGFHPESLDVIFTAMKGKRVFQPMGIKKVSEDVENENSQVFEHLQSNWKKWQFDDAKADYVDNAGQTLSGFVPSDICRKLRGVCDAVDWQKYDDEFKAIKRFDQREYWRERNEMHEAEHYLEQRNRELHPEFYKIVDAERREKKQKVESEIKKQFDKVKQLKN